ncbi:MAG: hypothetical protein ACHP65_01010 [Legionellales bacterium]
MNLLLDFNTILSGEDAALPPRTSASVALVEMKEESNALRP